MTKRCPVCNKPISDSAKTCLKHRPGNHVPARTTVLTDKANREMDNLRPTKVVVVPSWMTTRHD